MSVLQIINLLINSYANMKILSAIVLLIFASCATKQEISKVDQIKLNAANSDCKFAYIQKSNDEENYLRHHYVFGDIFVYNLNDSSVIQYTNDEFYDTELSWSPDGKKLLFASSRDVYDSTIHDQSQAEYMISLFTLDLKTGSILKLKINNNTLRYIPGICGLTWNKNGIYFANFRNIVYMIDEKSSTCYTILQINKEFHIADLSISNDGTYIALDLFSDDNKSQSQIGLYNIKSNTFEVFNLRGKVGGWNKNDESFFLISRDSVYSYNISTESLEYIPLLSNNENLCIEEIYFLNEEEIIQSSIENRFAKSYKKNIYQQNTNITFGIENLKTKKVWYPISRSNYRENLTPYGLQKYYRFSL